MPWTKAQRTRLITEKQILENFFPGKVEWIDPTEDTKVEVSLNTNNGNKYCLRIYLKSCGDSESDFPNSVPDMVKLLTIQVYYVFNSVYVSLTLRLDHENSIMGTGLFMA